MPPCFLHAAPSNLLVGLAFPKSSSLKPLALYSTPHFFTVFTPRTNSFLIMPLHSPSHYRSNFQSRTIVSCSSDNLDFNKEEYEKQRLAADEQARQAMAQVASTIGDTEERPGAFKWAIRKRIWDHLEDTNQAESPRPVHHRIPNFKGADRAAARLVADLPDLFSSAQCIKVNPDTPQKLVRRAVLDAGKILLTPQPRLRTGFFSKVEKRFLASNHDHNMMDDHGQDFEQILLEACTSAGVAKYGMPISLDEKIKVDLIVVGSVAVARNGARIGKGEGFAELEYGLLRWMQAIDQHTLVVTTVHDDQVVEDHEIPVEKMLEHDVPVDIIVTPTRVIKTNTKIPKPPGILWHKLSPQKLAQIKVLQELKKRIEAETGQLLPTGPDEILPPTAKRSSTNRRGGRGGRGGRGTARGRGGRGGARAGDTRSPSGNRATN